MTKLELAQKIDHTLLKPDATAEQIKKLCAEAVEHRFCSVCVNSGRAALAKSRLAGSDVKLCVVVGFPLGCSVAKAAEAAAMAELGADEIEARTTARFADNNFIISGIDAEYYAGVTCATK